MDYYASLIREALPGSKGIMDGTYVKMLGGYGFTSPKMLRYPIFITGLKQQIS